MFDAKSLQVRARRGCAVVVPAWCGCLASWLGVWVVVHLADLVHVFSSRRASPPGFD
jgi:hypothetical protein